MKPKTRFHKFTAWLLTLAMFMTFIPSFTLTVGAVEATVFSGGSGTEGDPFLISNLEELIYFNEMCAEAGDFDNCGQTLGWEVYHGAYFKLTADIDCSALEVWTPRTFAGHLDGDGHKIYNLNIGQVSQEDGDYIYYGFFDVLYDGSISNIIFENVEITIPSDAEGITSSSSVLAGVVAGEIYYASVDSVEVRNSSVAKESTSGNWTVIYIGGIAGTADGAYMNNCSVVNTSISSIKGYVGGLIGCATSFYYDVEQFVNEGYIFRFGGDNTGKFGVENSMIDDNSSVYVSDNYGVAGGMIGWLCPRAYDKVSDNHPGFVLKNCFSNASVEINQTVVNQAAATKGVGGIIGELSYADNPVTIENCYFAGEITDNLSDREGKGAIVGYSTRNDSEIVEMNNCYGLGLKTLGTDALYNVSYGGDSFNTPVGNATFDTDGVLTAEITGDTLLADSLLDVLNVWVNNNGEGYNSWTETEGYPVFGENAVSTSYAVTLNANGGTINSGEITSYIAGKETALPTNISKEGHEFAGWYEDENFTGSAVTTIGTTDTGDKEYFAKWEVLKYPVTFNAGNGAFSNGSKEITIDVEFGTVPVAPETPERAGYAFADWQPALAPVTVEGATYTATYAPSDVSYFVEIYTMDTTGAYGEPETEPKTAKTDSIVSVTPEAKESFTVDADASILEKIVEADGSTTLKVYYIRNRYDFTIVVDGTENTKTYYYEETVEAPTTPTKKDYTFDGWDVEIPTTMPAENVTVTAQWTKITPDITGISVDETSAAYNAGTNTFAVASDKPFVAYLTGENFDYIDEDFLKNTTFGFVPSVEDSENALGASLFTLRDAGFASIDAGANTITLTFDYNTLKGYLADY